MVSTMKTQNILEIYERLYKVGDNLTGESIEYITGFQNAVYMLSIALKNHEHINLHLENKRLKRQLLLTDLNFDDSMFTIVELRKQNTAYKNLIDNQEKRIAKLTTKKEVEIQKTVMGERLQDVEIDFEGTVLKFAINAPVEDFNLHFQEAVNYVYQRRDRKTKKVALTVIRNWFMQSYRDKGFKVVTA